MRKNARRPSERPCEPPRRWATLICGRNVSIFANPNGTAVNDPCVRARAVVCLSGHAHTHAQCCAFLSGHLALGGRPTAEADSTLAMTHALCTIGAPVSWCPVRPGRRYVTAREFHWNSRIPCECKCVCAHAGACAPERMAFQVRIPLSLYRYLALELYSIELRANKSNPRASARLSI